jgi:hypothetical protein
MSWGVAIGEGRLRRTVDRAVSLMSDWCLGRLVIVGTAMGFIALVTPEIAIATDSTISFNIPSQPLASALETYSSATGREALYNSNLIGDRKSRSIAGKLTPDVALERLLDGTGLSPRYLADGSFVVLSTPEAAPPGRVEAPSATFDRYYALIQDSLRKALCTNDRALPGGYRVVALLWIGASGTVVRHERLDALSARDAGAATETNEGIDQTLDHLAISEPPPAGFAQPVTVVVVPQADGVTMGCSSRSDDRAGFRSRHD